MQVIAIPTYANTATGEPPYPEGRWFQYYRTGNGILQLVSLQTEADATSLPDLVNSAPGGITAGLKLGSLVGGDREYAAIFFEAGLFGVRVEILGRGGFPGAQPSPRCGVAAVLCMPCQQHGSSPQREIFSYNACLFFNALILRPAKTQSARLKRIAMNPLRPAQVKFKDIASSETTSFGFDFFKLGNVAAGTTLRLRLYSPTLDKYNWAIWEPGAPAVRRVWLKSSTAADSPQPLVPTTRAPAALVLQPGTPPTCSTSGTSTASTSPAAPVTPAR